MPIIDNSPLIRLPENLLRKGAQNRTLGKGLAESTTVGKLCYKLSNLDIINDLVEWIEDNQMVMYNASRDKFAEVIKETGQESFNSKVEGK